MNPFKLAPGEENFEDPILAIHREIDRVVEQRLITRIEEIEGRVPTNSEVELFAQCAIFPNGRREWKWKGATIVILEPPPLDGRSYEYVVRG